MPKLMSTQWSKELRKNAFCITSKWQYFNFTILLHTNPILKMLVLRRLNLGTDLILFWQTSTDVRQACKRKPWEIIRRQGYWTKILWLIPKIITCRKANPLLLNKKFTEVPRIKATGNDTYVGKDSSSTLPCSFITRPLSYFYTTFFKFIFIVRETSSLFEL